MKTWLELTNPFPETLDNDNIQSYINCIRNGGKINHSCAGLTLSTVIKELEIQAVPYRLTAQPGIGYLIEGIKQHNQQSWYDFIKEYIK